MERITRKDLQVKIDLLNEKIPMTGKQFRVQGVYGGYRLVKKYDNSGIESVSQVVPARELLHILETILNVVYEVRI